MLLCNWGVTQMDEPVVSNPTVSSLAKVTVIYQIAPMHLYLLCLLLPTYVIKQNPDKTRACAR